MTPERWIIVGLAVLNAGAVVVATGSAAAGLPLWVGLIGTAVAAACGAGLGLMTGWFDAKPTSGS